MGFKSMEVKVGIVVVLAIVVGIAGLIWLGDIRMARSGYLLQVMFEDVGGLKVGDYVSVVGVNKGRVRGIELRGTEVLVTMWLSNDVQLAEDCRITIEDVAFISGTKYVRIDPGQRQKLLDLSQPVRGRGAAGFSLADIGSVVRQIEEIITLLQKNLLTEESMRSLRDAITDLSRISSSIEELVAKTGDELSEGARNLRHISGRLVDVLDQADLSGTMQRVEHISMTLDTLATALQQNESTLGRLVKDDSLYQDLRGVITDARDLLQDIQKNPKRYLSLF
jgi:phospholipid/cholesterol/gamma-HCH transport system substrate-binding protein